MNKYKQPLFVIQRSIATKDLGNIHFLLRYATEIFRFALNDKHVENACIPWVKINAARSVPTLSLHH